MVAFCSAGCGEYFFIFDSGEFLGRIYHLDKNTEVCCIRYRDNRYQSLEGLIAYISNKHVTEKMVWIWRRGEYNK